MSLKHIPSMYRKIKYKKEKKKYCQPTGMENSGLSQYSSYTLKNN